MARLQNDKEEACGEIVTLKDKIDLLSGQLNKSQRDRELALGDVEAIQEKYDKAATQAQRMLVRMIVDRGRGTSCVGAFKSVVFDGNIQGLLYRDM